MSKVVTVLVCVSLLLGAFHVVILGDVLKACLCCLIPVPLLLGNLCEILNDIRKELASNNKK